MQENYLNHRPMIATSDAMRLKASASPGILSSFTRKEVHTSCCAGQLLCA